VFAGIEIEHRVLFTGLEHQGIASAHDVIEISLSGVEVKSARGALGADIAHKPFDQASVFTGFFSDIIHGSQPF